MNEKTLQIKDKLSILKRQDFELNTFGSSSHLYQSNPLTEEQIGLFENKNNIKLPNDFRDFLIQIGIGAGPDYGILSLNQMETEFNEWAERKGGHSKINYLTEISSNKARMIEEEKTNNPEKFCSIALKNVNGILPIQTEGCTYFGVLVLNGDEVGKIWFIDINEYKAMPSGDKESLTFIEWYENWLDSSLEKANNNPHYKKILHTEQPWWKRIFS